MLSGKLYLSLNIEKALFPQGNQCLSLLLFIQPLADFQHIHRVNVLPIDKNLKMHMRAGTISAAADKADDFTLTHALTGRNGNPAHMPVSSFITIAVIDTYIASITAVPTGNPLPFPSHWRKPARQIQQQCQPQDASRNRHRSVPYVHRRES